jgi:tRNA 2-thiouridine synthesizing protein A
VLDKSAIPKALQLIMSTSARTQPVQLVVDARNLACPMPLLKARQGLRNLAQGDLLRVLATDSGSLKDFVSFAQLTGQKLEAFNAQDGVYCYLICKQ